MGAVATSTGESVDVILRDGGTLRLRPPTNADSEALLDFYRALSSQSLHRRFHGMPQLKPKLVESLLEPDWTERGALLAALADEGGERIVAIGNYVRLRDPGLAESAFAVADSEQGRGIGTRLLEQLAARAAGVGIERFVAEVLPENRSMLGVFERAGFELKRQLADGVVEVAVPDCLDGAVRAERRGTRPRRRRRLAALVLRADERRRRRRVVAPRNDRRRALPQRAPG